MKFLEKPENEKTTASLFENAEFPVLMHGDYRPSNMMHRVLKDGSVEAVILDYQTVKQGQPVTVLLYLILSGTDQEFRRKYLQETLDLYYTELSAALRRLNIELEEIYSKELYEQDIKKLLPKMVKLSFLMALMVTVRENDAPKVDKDMDFNSLDVKQSELFTGRVNGLVDDFIAKGVF